MAQEVYMDIPAVETMGKRFKTFGDILENIAKILKATITILKATALFGLVGNYALAAYLERIEPKVRKMAAKMDELSGDINGAIRSYRDGDNSGSQRFAG
jgi:hypothetical protein